MSVCIYEGERRTKAGERLEKMKDGIGVEQSVIRHCDMRVSVSLWGCPSQQLVPLNYVIEMTNRTAFFSFLQHKLAILSLAFPFMVP